MLPWNPFTFQKEWNTFLHQAKNEQPLDFMKSFFQQFAHLNQMPNQQANNDVETFVSFDHIYLHFTLPPEQQSHLKVTHTTEDVIIYHKNKELVNISLPALVEKDGGIAQMEDNILQVKLVRKIDTQLTEIHIRDN